MKPTLLLLLYLFTVLLLSCQNNANEKDRLAELADSASYTGLTRDSIKLVKTGSISLKVKDITQSTRSISILAQKFGGIIYDQNLAYEETARNELRISSDSLIVITAIAPHAGITVKVPSENIEEFMYNVADIGYFTSSRKIHIDDQSLMYLENMLKQKNRKEILSEASRQKNSSLKPYNALVVKDEGIEQHIRNRTIDADVRYSTLNLSLLQNAFIKREVIANNAIMDYQLPFPQRFNNAIRDGWQYFLSFILLLANMWIFILTGVAVYLFYRYLKQRTNLTPLKVKSR